jgi:uncharacterized protein (TIGR02147 family)
MLMDCSDLNEKRDIMPIKKPNIYDYKDYRVFLKDFYEHKKSLNPSFSTRIFAQKAGFGSHSYLKMVIDGKRNLSLKSLKKVGKALGLEKEEAAFFNTLALYNQASVEKDKDYYFQKLIELKPHKKLFKLEKDKFAYFTNKYLVIIRELVALPHFTEDYQWMSDTLGGCVSPDDIKKCVEALMRLNLLTRDKDGKLVQASGTLESPVDADSLEIFNYHRSIISYVKDVMIAVPQQNREIISITIPMSESILPEIKNILRKCRDEVIKCINQKDKGFDDVFQVNMQMVPVTKSRKDQR